MTTLETKRLILRPWQQSDLDDFAAMMADPDVARYITLDQQPQSRALAWRTLAGVVGHWTLKGFGMWAVEVKDTGTVIGRIGPHEPEGWPQLEVGWSLARPYWGQGYALEAARASMAWTFAHFPDLQRIIHLIVPENAPSIALAERLGSRWHNEETVEVLGITARVYSQSRAV